MPTLPDIEGIPAAQFKTNVTKRLPALAKDHYPESQPRRAAVLRRALELAPEMPEPAWRMARGEHVWVVDSNYVLRVWRLANKRWCCQVIGATPLSSYVCLQETASSGKAQLEAYLLWRIASADVSAEIAAGVG